MHIHQRRRGAGLMEYGIVGGLIALIAIGATIELGSKNKCLIHDISSYILTTPDIPGCDTTTPKTIYWIQSSTNQQPIAMTYGTTGVNYTNTIPLAISPTHRPITYSLSTGTLPTGLALDPQTGAITGTPSANPSNLASTASFQVSATDGVSTTQTDEYIKLPIAGRIVFQYTGADQTFTMPNATIKIKMWGAAGGSMAASEYGAGGDNLGGPGGYSYGQIQQNALAAGTPITVVVGGGGLIGSGPGAYGGGGPRAGSQPSSTTDPNTLSAEPNSRGGGSRGGGESALRINGQDEMVAGGGGGVGVQTITQACNGGAGGGNNGSWGDGKAYWGGSQGWGGTQTAGGQNVNDAAYQVNNAAASTGGRDQGGTALEAVTVDGTPTWAPQANGSGGGGYYGGGAGAVAGQGAGGGGSSYINGPHISNGTTSGGTNGGNPGNSQDTDRPAGVGQSNTRSQGGPGAVVITWGPN